MLSSTLSSGTRLSSWFTSAIPCAWASCGLRSESSWPSRRITPSSGLTRPTRAFTRVLLPAPLCPQIACTSPTRTSSERPRTALTGPYDLEKSTTSRSTGRPAWPSERERDPAEISAGSRSPLIESELVSLEGAELRELGYVRRGDALLLDVLDLRARRLAAQDLSRQLDRECRLDL